MNKITLGEKYKFKLTRLAESESGNTQDSNYSRVLKEYKQR